MSEATLTLDTPEVRTTTTTSSDVDKVQIADPIEIDFSARLLTFKYTKGYQSGAVIINTVTSGTISASGDQFDAIVQAAVDAADNLGENLTAVLLQYLIDTGEVGAGTIAP